MTLPRGTGGNPWVSPNRAVRGVERGVSVIAAVVLAAGSSSRMGEPKPLVRVGDRPLLTWVLEAVRGSRVSEVVVVLGDAADRIRAEVPLAAVRVVENPSYREGMSSSLRTGISSLSDFADAFFVVLADAPFVRSESYDALITVREKTRARIVLPTYHGVRGNPVLLDRSLGPEADSITGDRGCREIRQRHPDETAEVPLDDPGVLIDIDTPEEAELAREAIREGRPLGSLAATLSRAANTGGRTGDPARSRMRGPEKGRPGGEENRPAQLVIIGDSPVSESLASLGRVLGFRVVVAGPDLDPARYPDADAVVTDLNDLARKFDSDTFGVVAGMPDYEVRALALLLRSQAAYRGLVASRRRIPAVREALLKEGVSNAEIDRLHGPAGLDIGAQTPEEIALSVAAEMVRVARERPSASR